MALFAICQIVFYSKLRLQHVLKLYRLMVPCVSLAPQVPYDGWQLLRVLVQGSPCENVPRHRIQTLPGWMTEIRRM